MKTIRRDYGTGILWTLGAFLLTAFLLICCGSLIYNATTELSPGEQQLMRLEFIPSVRNSFFPEQRERAVFVSLALLSIPLIFMVLNACGIFSKTICPESRSMRWASSGINIFLLLVAATCIIVAPPYSPKFHNVLFAPALSHYSLWLAILTLTLTLVCGLFKLNLKWQNHRIFTLMLPLIPIVQISYCRIYVLELVSNEVPDHPNIIAYALSQAARGNFDYHQYGFYHWMLSPIFAVVPVSILNISGIMAILFFAGCLAVYWVLRKYIKNWILLLPFAFTLFLTTGGNWFFNNDGLTSSIDPYFAYYPVRFIFPAMSVLIFTCLVFFRKMIFVALGGILSGAGLWWNFDSGLPVLGAFFAVFGLELILDKNRNHRLAQLLCFMGSAATIFLILLFIFSLQHGQMVSVPESAKYIKLFSSSGFMMMPMPKLPASWGILAGIYLLSLVIGLRFFIARKFNRLARISIFIAVLGTGLFTYYQGRSHIYNLAPISWPALMLAFIYTDRIARLVKTRLISKSYGLLVFPAILFSACAMITVACGTKSIASGIERTWRGIAAPSADCALEQDIRFILQHAGDAQVINIISDMSGIYYAETGLRSGIANLCLFELFFIKDWSRISEELKRAQCPLIISKQRFADNLLNYYRLKAVTKNGKLLYLVPIQTSVPAAKIN